MLSLRVRFDTNQDLPPFPTEASFYFGAGLRIEIWADARPVGAVLKNVKDVVVSRRRVYLQGNTTAAVLFQMRSPRDRRSRNSAT